MEKIYTKARAKINLNLEILSKRPDNYHNIKSVFQKINLYDELFIQKNNNNKFDLTSNIDALNNEDNIIYKAYLKLKEKYNCIGGVSVTLNKKIPLQAGMGGGSTDCSSFLSCMNKLFDLNMSKEELTSIGKSLGADVVPCFYNKALVAEEIGDKITLLDTSFKYYILVIKPTISCSTKNMYQKLDSQENRIIIDTSDNIISALQNNDIKLLSDSLYNTFETVIEEKHIIEELKKELTLSGALGALMTGSGSCVYGIFENKKTAKLAYLKLKEKYETYLCISYNSKKEEIF